MRLDVVTVPIAIAVGLLIAVVYSFHHKWMNLALLVWIDLFRSFPVLVLLILIFYGLPFLGLKLPSFAACVLAVWPRPTVSLVSHWYTCPSLPSRMSWRLAPPSSATSKS